MRQESKKIVALAGTVAGLLVLGGCGLSNPDIPGFDGNSTRYEDLRMNALPDYVRADGHSTAWIDLQLNGPDGVPMPNRRIVLALTDPSGIWADIGTLARESVTTDGAGRARVKYTAPLRQHFTANSSVLVVGRPTGSDYLGQARHVVSIEIRSVETHTYPGGGGKPTCAFAVDPPIGPYYVNESIHFQSTSTDSDGVVVKYYWYFGDPSDPERNSDLPELYHHWSTAGSYVVQHAVTDDDGNQAVCDRKIDILDAP